MFFYFGKDGHRQIPKNRLMASQYLSKNMNGLLLIWYQYLLQNIKLVFWGDFWSCYNFGIIFPVQKQSFSYRVFINNGILRWWNLDELWNYESMKNILGNLKLVKHEQILLTQTYFWKAIEYLWMVLFSIGSKTIGSSRWNLDKSLSKSKTNQARGHQHPSTYRLPPLQQTRVVP